MKADYFWTNVYSNLYAFVEPLAIMFLDLRHLAQHMLLQLFFKLIRSESDFSLVTNSLLSLLHCSEITAELCACERVNVYPQMLCKMPIINPLLAVQFPRHYHLGKCHR